MGAYNVSHNGFTTCRVVQIIFAWALGFDKTKQMSHINPVLFTGVIWVN